MASRVAEKALQWCAQVRKEDKVFLFAVAFFGFASVATSGYILLAERFKLPLGPLGQLPRLAPILFLSVGGTFFVVPLAIFKAGKEKVVTEKGELAKAFDFSTIQWKEVDTALAEFIRRIELYNDNEGFRHHQTAYQFCSGPYKCRLQSVRTYLPLPTGKYALCEYNLETKQLSYKLSKDPGAKAQANLVGKEFDVEIALSDSEVTSVCDEEWFNPISMMNPLWAKSLGINEEDPELQKAGQTIPLASGERLQLVDQYPYHKGFLFIRDFIPKPV